MSKVVSLANVDGRDEQMYLDRLAGISTKTIAKRYGVSEAEVMAAIDRCLTPLDLQMRRHTLQLELDRLDEMESIFHLRMKEGDLPTAHLMLKIKELRADFCGTRAPLRIDAVQLAQAAEPSSTDKIQAALDALAERKTLPKPDGDDEPAGPAAEEGQRTD